MSIKHSRVAVPYTNHTPENIFCGDSLFNPDVGSARCDFPGGSTADLCVPLCPPPYPMLTRHSFATATKLLSLPPTYKIYTGHDYPPPDARNTPQALSTVADQREHNKHLKAGTAEADFVRWRTERDTALAEPRLIHQALQVNIRGGGLPAPSGGGKGDRLLHVPVKVAGGRVW